MSEMFPDDDDPEKIPLWYKLTPWERSRSIVMPYGETEDSNGAKRLDYALFRIPHNLRPLWVLGDVIAGLQRGALSPEEAASSITAAMVQNFNPMGGDTVTSSLAPTALDPFVELATNRTWTGVPIRPDSAPWNEGVPNSQNYFTGRTSQTAIDFAQAINAANGGDSFDSGFLDMYPNQLEYALRYVAGGFGGFVTQSIDAARDAATGTPTPPERMPGQRMLMGKTSWKDEQTRFYANKEQMDAARNAIRTAKKLAEKSGDTAAFEDVQRRAMQIGAVAEFGKDIIWKDSLPKIFDGANEAIQEIRSEIYALRASDLTRAEIAAKTRELELEIETLMRAARTTYVDRAMRIQDP